jgi:thiol:disulfide interchange protein DsbA
MEKIVQSMLAVAALFISLAASAEAQQGKDYTLLSPAQPTSTKKIEVLEFFFYGCSHCYHLYGPLSTWEKTMPKDVELIFVPTMFRDSMEPMARAMYALESVGQRQKLDDPLYRAWNVDGTGPDLNDQAKLTDFVAKYGVDRTKFGAAYNGFTTQSKVSRAKQMVRSYKIEGTPTLIVDGKYVITGLQPSDMVRALNDVIALARKSHAK